jgi:hypothetical protein
MREEGGGGGGEGGGERGGGGGGVRESCRNYNNNNKNECNSSGRNMCHAAEKGFRDSCRSTKNKFSRPPLWDELACVVQYCVQVHTLSVENQSSRPSFTDRVAVGT